MIYNRLTEIEVIRVKVTKEMPLDVFQALYRFSYFSELMQPAGEGKIQWDPDVESVYDEKLAEILYDGLQKGNLEVYLTIPKDWMNGETS